ncbi:Transposase IS116/IS110/IS902 family protein [Bacteroidales bacterium Barb6XT]|nr:Transposase IS116/IS110/IS902 family protein [Bacteroidales bacterium Barb6XT]
MKKYITGIGISREKPDPCFTQAEKTLREEETTDTTAAVRQALKTFLKEACAETSDFRTKPVCTICRRRTFCTAESIGDKTAVKMIVVTKGFTDFTDARKFCYHAGAASFSYSSGSSIRSRNRVSQRADKSIKALLHMAVPVVATRCRGGTSQLL